MKKILYPILVLVVLLCTSCPITPKKSKAVGTWRINDMRLSVSTYDIDLLHPGEVNDLLLKMLNMTQEDFDLMAKYLASSTAIVKEDGTFQMIVPRTSGQNYVFDGTYVMAENDMDLVATMVMNLNDNETTMEFVGQVVGDVLSAEQTNSNITKLSGKFSRE